MLTAIKAGVPTDSFVPSDKLSNAILPLKVTDVPSFKSESSVDGHRLNAVLFCGQAAAFWLEAEPYERGVSLGSLVCVPLTAGFFSGCHQNPARFPYPQTTALS